MRISKKEVRTKETENWDLEIKVTSPEEASQAMARILQKETAEEEREHYMVLALNTKNFITGYYIASIGNLNSALVSPRETFRFAILEGAASIIIGHNHPSGDTTPSKEDLTLTKKIADAGDIVGIKVFDHIITGKNQDYYSLRANGEI